MQQGAIDGLAGDAATAIVTRGLCSPGVPFQASVGADRDAIVAAAVHHRVLVLLGALLRSAGTLDSWPPEFVDAFVPAERQAAAVDCIRQVEVRRVLAALASRRIGTLTFKGAALAHCCYPAPHLRPRTDTDLLVAAADVPALDATFASLGYERQRETSGQLATYQSHYGKADRHGVFHAFDMHWKISNRQALADRFTFEELWERRTPVPALGPFAATVDPVLALTLALVHRAGHHPGSCDLLWIYDLHVLLCGLTEEERQQVEDIAGARGLSQIAREGLALTRDWFATPAADRIIDALRRRPAHPEDVAVIRGASSHTDLLRLDLRALPTWGQRRRLIREHLFPAPRYMREKYGIRSNFLLPVFYAWRVVAGAPRWLRRPGAPR
jgi:hypothetical protein